MLIISTTGGTWKVANKILKSSNLFVFIYKIRDILLVKLAQAIVMKIFRPYNNVKYTTMWGFLNYCEYQSFKITSDNVSNFSDMRGDSNASTLGKNWCVSHLDDEKKSACATNYSHAEVPPQTASKIIVTRSDTSDTFSWDPLWKYYSKAQLEEWAV